MQMLNNCANPKCAKPLHYLREGRIFVFDVTGEGETVPRRLEHYWLCGQCSVQFLIEREKGSDMRLVPRHSVGKERPSKVVALAS
jgi:hypothetical protein